ncbi:hypothetical protein Tco_0315614 [Tanacetum coccineum]
MILQAVKTWFQIYGFWSKLPMINMHYGESFIGENNVEVMRKDGYGYLKEIVVRRADNDLYRFKEGDFPRLCINDIKDMLLLVVQNRLTNLSGDDVSDFAIALRMFTRSLVFQKRVEDLQLGVESYQKKIKVTRPQTTISNELYKFSDRTLTGLQTSLDDITKNIRMEYLPKRRWSTLEKKRANFMIKAIDNQNQRDLPRDIPLDSVVVLRYEKRSKSENKGKVPTEMELVLEQTQQGTYKDECRVKELQDKLILKAFKLSYQEKYEHVGLKSQDHKMARLQDDVKRLCLVDDLKKLEITFYQVKDHYNISQVND